MKDDVDTNKTSRIKNTITRSVDLLTVLPYSTRNAEQYRPKQLGLVKPNTTLGK